MCRIPSKSQHDAPILDVGASQSLCCSPSGFPVLCSSDSKPTSCDLFNISAMQMEISSGLCVFSDGLNPSGGRRALRKRRAEFVFLARTLQEERESRL